MLGQIFAELGVEALGKFSETPTEKPVEAAEQHGQAAAAAASAGDGGGGCDDGGGESCPLRAAPQLPV